MRLRSTVFLPASSKEARGLRMRRDAEGRTALHLAAGCGDRPMVAKLVQLGTDVNCRDSVGGAPALCVSASYTTLCRHSAI